ncbi:uncharacterized protein LOC126834898 [Adelges cooleyi]|uniref:uncharacterized protein LOC126834898 n=1 Tax=Adelges cooleyi TaxID=133065 RepID=UPI0021807A32|nr:uncharacterized protein LOC126834898 [Adelges cooleyi]
MLSILLLSCFVGCSVLSVNAYDTYYNQSQVMDASINYMFTCLSELQINPDVCKEMLNKNTDKDDKKFDGCKCLGPCVGKKMGTMNAETGKWDLERFKTLTDLLESGALKDEAKKIEECVKDEVNTHCNAGYPMVLCIMKHSSMAKEMLQNYMDSNEESNEQKGDQ